MPNPSFSHINLSNAQIFDEMYAKFKQDPSSLDETWRCFFEGFETSKGSTGGESPDLRVHYLIEAYREYGHLKASTNPISVAPPVHPEELSLKRAGFTEADLHSLFPTCGLLPQDSAPLSAIVEVLQKTYCRTIGVEFCGLENPELEDWIIERIEPNFKVEFSASEKGEILENLNKAEFFEQFIQTKYVGQKRFSLEGGETLIPMLEALVMMCGKSGAREIVIGMAHRGRLNVLANILGKSYGLIFSEFEEGYSPVMFEGVGDVKYHKGFVGIHKVEGAEVKVTLTPNPSHLESVDPVVEGIVRSKQDEGILGTVPVLIHGDAALAGQGVVYETMQMSGLEGYKTGGTIHIVVNNHIGFTAVPTDSRSMRYCTSLAKAFGSPVFHVNAEDPEGCVHVMRLAVEIRQKFGLDVFVDLNCYRKYGHNESDEPRFTQPVEYKIIGAKESIRSLYRKALVSQGVLSEEDAAMMEKTFQHHLRTSLEMAKTPPKESSHSHEKKKEEAVETAVPGEKLKELARLFCTVPEGFEIHKRLGKLVEGRLAMLTTDQIDWGMGEHLAFATLLDEGTRVRISGQDSGRGTFSHRHAVWADQSTDNEYFPLAHLKANQGAFSVYDSLLSEFAVLGFEFGYSLVSSNSLVIWEAQFGDFCNGAQIIIDQYITTCEQKWGSTSHLAMLLPHGNEGAGAEHSSGRIERFLQMASDDNIQVCNCTLPAQLFHLLRRQAKRKHRKPLILFTPKAILRHPGCVSPVSEFEKGSFKAVLDDSSKISKPKIVAFVSGKVYFDLIAEREKRGRNDMVFIRLEQVYPFPDQEIKEIVSRYVAATKWLWIQEEHENMGAWEFVRPNLEKLVGTLEYRGRGRSAVTAAGSKALHDKQQIALMESVFNSGVSHD